MNSYSMETDVKELMEPIMLTEMKPLNAPDVRRRLINDKKEDEANNLDPEHNNSIDLSLYNSKKSIAQGMLDLSLISANCSQLKYLLFHYERGRPDAPDSGPMTKTNDYYFIINLSCIAISIGLQVLVGILLICNVKHNISVHKYFNIADSYSNAVLFLVFLITVCNIFLSIFISA